MVIAFASAPGVAQTEAPTLAAEEAPAERASYDAEALSDQGFQAVSGRGDEASIPGGRLMLAAYLAFLALLAGYGVRLAARHTAVQGELANLRRLMEDVDDRLDELEKRRPGQDRA